VSVLDHPNSSLHLSAHEHGSELSASGVVTHQVPLTQHVPSAISSPEFFDYLTAIGGL